MTTRIALIISITLLAVSAAWALPANDVATTYYADAAHTKWVGSVETTCSGGILKYGRTSPFYVKQSDSCRDHRISSITLNSLSRDPRTRAQVCYAMCYKKFGGPHPCEPDGCPYKDALNQCDADCDANNPPN